MLSSGTSTLSIIIIPVVLARSDIFPSILGHSKPGKKTRTVRNIQYSQLMSETGQSRCWWKHNKLCKQNFKKATL